MTPDPPPASPPGSGSIAELEVVTTVAAAAAQPTAVGREIHRLGRRGRLLYPMFGDYGANTGPIDLVSYNLDDMNAAPTTEATLHTEETWTLRETSGHFYVPFTDPQSGPPDGTPGQYAVAGATGPWTIIRNITPVPVHVFAVIETVDGIFVFGAGFNGISGDEGGPQVWRSTDNGATWAVSLAPRPDPTGMSRFYGALTFGNDIITMASDSGLTYRWSAGTWAPTTQLITGSWVQMSDVLPYSYQGTPYNLLLLRGKPEAAVQFSPVAAITADRDPPVEAAITASLGTDYCYDAKVSTSGLWLLTASLHVVRVDTDGTRTDLAGLIGGEEVVRSIDVDEVTGFLHFGTTDSRILRTPIPV